MSVYPAPNYTETLSVFNTINWETTTSSSSDTTKLDYPTAQGLETFPSGIKFGDTTTQLTASDYPYYSYPNQINFYAFNPTGITNTLLYLKALNFNIASSSAYFSWVVEVSVIISPLTFNTGLIPPVLQAYGVATFAQTSSGGSKSISCQSIVDSLKINGVANTASIFQGNNNIVIGTVNGFNFGTISNIFSFGYGTHNTSLQGIFTFSQNAFTGTGTSNMSIQAYARIISSNNIGLIAGVSGSSTTYSPNSSSSNNGGGSFYFSSTY